MTFARHIKQGFTLIELLIVIAVIGILAAIGLINYARWRATSSVQQGVQVFTQVLTKTRTEAKRLNVCQKVSLPVTSAATSLSVTRYSGSSCTGTASTPVSYTMPSNVTITLISSTNAVSFQPPYGTTDAIDKTFDVTWASDTSIKRAMRVTGVFGKVIVK